MIISMKLYLTNKYWWQLGVNKFQDISGLGNLLVSIQRRLVGRWRCSNRLHFIHPLPSDSLKTHKTCRLAACLADRQGGTEKQLVYVVDIQRLDFCKMYKIEVIRQSAVGGKCMTKKSSKFGWFKQIGKRNI